MRDLLSKIDTSKIKALVVDDEPLLREFMKRLLLKEGFEVVVAVNGKDACSVISSDSDINLIISDIRMPEMDGSELLDWVTKNHRHIPMMLMTGYSDLSIADALAKGAKKVLSKPFKAEVLKEALGEVLSPADQKWAKSEDYEEAEIVDFAFKSLKDAEEKFTLIWGNGGFKLKSEKALYRDELYTFNFSFENEEISKISITGVVKWENASEPSSSEYGIEIISVDSDALSLLIDKLNILEKESYIPAA